jgi:putative toxin-antitoxin system antitoxin component (TIGR02293 family)
MRRCLFLDRDGVINAAPPAGEYIRSWDGFRLLPEVVSWIRLFKAAGFLAIVLTNQRGIALGQYSEADLLALHEKMRAELAAQGAILDDIFYCPHAEGACNCRKPLPGMVNEAQRKWDIDLSASLLIGDGERDRLLAERCGIPFALVRDGRVVATSHCLSPASITPTPTTQVIGAVRKGLPTGKLTQLAQLLAVDRVVLLRILGVSERTIQRKHVLSERLSPAASDRLSRIDRIYTLAVEVFGDDDKAAQWLKRPSRALANELPLKLLDTDAGTQQVERELRQIQYGFVY